MITDKQRQKDFEYEADYKNKCPYTQKQWAGILNSGQLDDQMLSLIKFIYSSYNHAANLIQISFHHEIGPEDALQLINHLGETLGKANELESEVDYEGNEYWWYLCFWGKNLSQYRTLELKMQPELSEAVGQLWPELEQAYYAFVSDVDRSLQYRYSQEDSVWIASALLLYEKYYQYPGISTDDILLMQYEVQTRAQKVFGQDVDANTISVICNADERGHRLNYLRDIYKYYRVAFPGEFDGDRERPDPEELDYGLYVYSLFGYMTLDQLYDFIEHEYAHLVDESYVEQSSANGFVRLADFLTRKGGLSCDLSDNSEKALSLRADGEDAETTFHMLAEALLKEYPNFTWAHKSSWYLEDEQKIPYIFYDQLYIKDYEATGACISFATIPEGDAVNIEVSLNLPYCRDEEAMLAIQDKCNKLTLMTSAAFQVETRNPENYDLDPESRKIKASVVYPYSEFISMKEEDIIGLMSSSMEIFASYYTDICQNYYPADAGDQEQDPMAAALGDKLIYKKAADTPGPQIIYKEGTISASTDFVTRAIQGYGQAAQEVPENISYEDTATGGSGKKTIRNQNTQSGFSGIPGPEKSRVSPVEHPDRSDQSFRLYPKNTLIKGQVKTAKYHKAILTAVGIIEGKEYSMVSIEPVPDVLEHYKGYVEEGRILQISCPDLAENGYPGWIEQIKDGVLRDGIFKDFANRCGAGRYVVMMEDVDLNWMHLFGEATVLLRENRREGASSETAVTLAASKALFRLPSNLYIVATCDSLVCEDTVTGAIDQDFFIRHVNPEPGVLGNMRVEGITLERLMTVMNLRISYFLTPDYQLGEGFFLASPEKDPMISLGRVFREQIIPLLEKWFDGDMERIRYVLGDNGKTDPAAMFYQVIPFRKNLFKGQLPDDFDTERIIYQINEDAFFNPRSYIEIYQ
ncbi:MAG: hypothetical protein IJI25_11265 [Eubacterium sp.]|nr:hypothetical protein [Eubacterium sp.]